MSYRCQNCGEAQPIGTQPTKVVTHIRTYDNDPAWQIAKEIDACGDCAESLDEKGPRETRISKGPGYTPYNPLPDFKDVVNR